MSMRDYILCGECKCKLIYDGSDAARDRLEQVWGDPKAEQWTVSLLCPDCIKKLRAAASQAAGDERGEFEEWARRHSPGFTIAWDDLGPWWKNERTPHATRTDLNSANDAWAAWQARAARKAR